MTSAIVAKCLEKTATIEYIRVEADGYYAGLGKDLNTFACNQEQVDKLMHSGPILQSIKDLGNDVSLKDPFTTDYVSELFHQGCDYIYLWIPAIKEAELKHWVNQTTMIDWNSNECAEILNYMHQNGGTWLCTKSIKENWFFVSARSSTDSFVRKIRVENFLNEHSEIDKNIFYDICDKSINLSCLLKNTLSYTNSLQGNSGDAWKQWVKNKFGTNEYQQVVGTKPELSIVEKHVQALNQVALLMNTVQNWQEYMVDDWLEKLTGAEQYLKQIKETL